MAEIENIRFQLGEIAGRDLGLPIIENAGSMQDFLCCIACGMIQFVCIRTGREKYHSLTQDHICIHPGSVIFKQDPVFIVAGEIVRTSRIFAMSVSPLTKNMLDKINPKLYERLQACKNTKADFIEPPVSPKAQKASSSKSKNQKNRKIIITEDEPENTVSIGEFVFATTKIKGKKTAVLPLEYFRLAVMQEKNEQKLQVLGNMRGKIITRDNGTLMDGNKLSLMMNIARNIDITPLSEKKWNRKMNVNIYNPVDKETLIDSLQYILRPAIAKQKGKEYGFITLFTDGNGNYWFKVSRGFTTAQTESHHSLEMLIEEQVDFTADDKKTINECLRIINSLYDN